MTYWTEWMKGICLIWSRADISLPHCLATGIWTLVPKVITGPKSRGTSFGTTLWRHVQRYCAHFSLFMQIMCSGYSFLRKCKFSRTNLFFPSNNCKITIFPSFQNRVIFRIFAVFFFFFGVRFSTLIKWFSSYLISTQPRSQLFSACFWPISPKTGHFFPFCLL